MWIVLYLDKFQTYPSYEITIFTLYILVQFSGDIIEERFITDAVFGGNFYLFDYNYLIQFGFPINKIDISDGETFCLAKGGFPDFNNNLMVYSVEYGLNSHIAIFDFDSNENSELSEKGMKPKYSDNAKQICFIGQYITNPKSKKYLTN
jgi:hypothetical protein